MAKSTGIIWARSTFNAWTGCTKVGPGCDHCYAEAMQDKRLHVVQWGPGRPRKRTSPANWKQPMAWNREAPGSEFMGRKGFWPVFVNSASDVFDNEVDPQWRADLFALIRATPNLTWLLLTKRIGNARYMLLKAGNWQSDCDATMGLPLPNVWIGATVVNQAEADRDIPKLLTVPAAKRFLSVEPMLGPIDLERPIPGPDLDQGGGAKICQPWYIQSGIDWVIAGGESGPQARPAHPDWFRSLRDQCAAAGVPFLFKQWGEYWEVAHELRDDDGEHVRLDADSPHDAEYFQPSDRVITLDGRVFDSLEEIPEDTPCRHMTRLGTKAAGNHLDGRQHLEFPQL
jgi:protein gp37